MYCTIAPQETSSAGLSSDAWRSYTTLRTHARSLAGFSASFAHEAAEISQAYEAALQAGSESGWRAFIKRCHSLVEHCNAVEALAGFSVPERAARSFFAQIVDENRDLIDYLVTTAA
jgi:hypothetical protein